MTGIMQMFVGAVAAAVDEYFKYVTLLLPGNGTNGAQNNTFLDSSTNNFTITRNGNTTQGTFAPYGSNWSNYFDGTANGFLSTPPTTDLDLSGDFTLQAWIYPTADSQSSGSEIICRGAPSTFNGWHFYYYNNKLNFGFNYAGFLGANTTTIPKNTWTHVAITRNGNTFTYYFNGVADGTFTSSSAPTTNGSDVVYVGRGSYDTSNRQFPGYISNVSVIKGAALTTFNTTTPLSTSTSSQSLLTCTANRFIDTNTATAAKTITAGSGVSVQRFSPFNPTAPYAAGTDGGSGYWDGTGDYLTVADNAALDMGSSNFTIEGWIFPTVSSSGSVGIFSKRANSGTTAGVLLYYNGAGLTPSLLIESGGSWVINQASSIAFTANQWNHFAAVRNGSSFVLYINGTSGATGTSAGSITDNSAAFAIGAWAADGTGVISASYISNFRVVKGTAVYTANFTPPTAPLTAITNTSLLLNYTNAGIIDNAEMNNLETVGNAQISTAQSKFGGGSMYFDGTGDWLTAPNSKGLYIGSGDFTIEGWLYLNALGSVRAIVSQFNSNGSGPGWTLYTKTTNVLEFYGGSGTVTVTGTAAIASTTWTHFAVVRSGSTITIYVNGTAGGTATNSSFSDDTSALVYVGGRADSASLALNGYIDDLRITKGYARYTANFTAPTAPFPLQ